MTIVVFGSLNMDLVVHAARLPRPGETLTGHTFATLPGGKGANQAVACARLGTPTAMVGRVGGDEFGRILREGLRADGVDVTHVAGTPGTSGVALIGVADGGENTIVVVPGANGQVGEEDLARLAAALDGARVLLLQLEVPLEAVTAAAVMARERGVVVVLDPAPARPLPTALYAATDILTPNAGEAAALVGYPLDGTEAVERAAREMCGRGAHHVIIKRGADGVYWFDGTIGAVVPPFDVPVVDTVAAGDAFNGGLAVALHEGRPFDEAVRWGAAAGALAVTRHGAQPAMPYRAEVDRLLAGGRAGDLP